MPAALSATRSSGPAAAGLFGCLPASRPAGPSAPRHAGPARNERPSDSRTGHSPPHRHITAHCPADPPQRNRRATSRRTRTLPQLPKTELTSIRSTSKHIRKETSHEPQPHRSRSRRSPAAAAIALISGAAITHHGSAPMTLTADSHSATARPAPPPRQGRRHHAPPPPAPPPPTRRCAWLESPGGQTQVTFNSAVDTLAADLNRSPRPHRRQPPRLRSRRPRGAGPGPTHPDHPRPAPPPRPRRLPAHAQRLHHRRQPAPARPRLRHHPPGLHRLVERTWPPPTSTSGKTRPPRSAHSGPARTHLALPPSHLAQTLASAELTDFGSE